MRNGLALPVGVPVKTLESSVRAHGKEFVIVTHDQGVGTNADVDGEGNRRERDHAIVLPRREDLPSGVDAVDLLAKLSPDQGSWHQVGSPMRNDLALPAVAGGPV